MQKLFQTTGVVLVLAFSSFAQNTEPVPAPAEVILNFTTEGDQHQFHLGELIPVKYSYAATPDKYRWLSQYNKLTAGRGLDVTCSPSAEPVRRSPLGAEADDKFEKMLNAPCGGVGGGFASACGDCDSELLLSDTAINFGPIPLNIYVRFRTLGTYACIASSSDVTAASSEEKIRYALLVKSRPLDLTIVDDPQWAHSAATTYAAAYDKFCRGNEVPKQNFLQCSDIAERITYLDTSDSLLAEVKYFDGRNHGWNNEFWEAIQHTSYPPDAVRWMTERVQNPDVEVSTTTLEWLASSDLRIESPDAFETDSPTQYHRQAVEKLRKYVRLVGSSLSKKNSSVLLESAKTYRFFAKQQYCEKQPLIPDEEQNQWLSTTGIRP